MAVCLMFLSLVCVILAAMETDAEKQKEEAAAAGDAAASAASKGDAPQV